MEKTEENFGSTWRKEHETPVLAMMHRVNSRCNVIKKHGGVARKRPRRVNKKKKKWSRYKIHGSECSALFFRIPEGQVAQERSLRRATLRCDGNNENKAKEDEEHGKVESRLKKKWKTMIIRRHKSNQRALQSYVYAYTWSNQHTTSRLPSRAG